jgi:hypothetical protein
LDRIVIFLVVSVLLSIARADSADLYKTWKFTEMIYHGERIPRPNPELNLTWTFFSNGTSRLYWDRGDETIFCERFAHYTYVDSKLTETNFAVNPNNAYDCKKDPDMQLGSSATTPLTFSNGELHLHLDMSGEELIYVLTDISNAVSR